VKAMVKRGDILFSMSEYEEALREYSKAKEIEPSNYILNKTIFPN
jgi:tetratricopeptide (TPR) repeat protein